MYMVCTFIKNIVSLKIKLANKKEENMVNVNKGREITIYHVFIDKREEFRFGTRKPKH